MSGELKLGMTFGYWGKGPNPNMVEQAQIVDEALKASRM